MPLRPVRTHPVAPPRLVRLMVAVTWAALPATVLAGCSADEPDAPAAAQEERGPIERMFSPAPDELPVMANEQLPFRYPPSLYAQRVQGNVTLRLFVDSLGTVVADSTRVEETSGNALLDSAATDGARSLRFRPARRRGAPMAVSLLYPVYFRHPEAAPLPGDTLLRNP